MANSTMVAEFLPLGSADGWNLSFLYFTIFPLTYLGTLLGNLIIIVSTAGQKLHMPMYFFLRNLSILNMSFISITVPSACVNSIPGHRVISVAGCATEIILVIFFGCVDLLFLTIMVWIYYMAICELLQHLLFMVPQLCVCITLASLISGLLYAVVHTAITFWLFFYQLNMAHQFFCDVPSVLILSCTDKTSKEVLLPVSAVVVGGGCFTSISLSYVRIFSTVLKFPTRKSGKAFSTCNPHILVVSLFLSSGTAVYLGPSAASDTLQDLLLSAFYTMVSPFLNSLIYSLRNKQSQGHANT